MMKSVSRNLIPYIVFATSVGFMPLSQARLDPYACNTLPKQNQCITPNASGSHAIFIAAAAVSGKKAKAKLNVYKNGVLDNTYYIYGSAAIKSESVGLNDFVLELVIDDQSGAEFKNGYAKVTTIPSSISSEDLGSSRNAAADILDSLIKTQKLMSTPVGGPIDRYGRPIALRNSR